MTFISPFRLWAATYADLGWSPIPLPYREKWPPPDNFTGETGRYVDATTLAKWRGPRGRATAGKLNYPPGNVAFRLPGGPSGAFEVPGDPGRWEVLGFDVDAYPGKEGGKTLAAAEAEYGRLPETWASSSKVDSPTSGIRYFRVPAGLGWPGDLRSRFGGGVELIRWDHRYAIVGPSLHDKTGDEYFWRSPEGFVIYLSEVADGAEIELPAPTDLPELPEKWVSGLTGGALRGAARPLGTEGELPESEVKAWIKARDDRPEAGTVSGSMCTEMARSLRRAQADVMRSGDDGGSHDAARDGAWGLIRDSAGGHIGLGKALGKLKATFLEAVRERRGGARSGERIATGEWKRFVVRGVSKVLAEGAPEDADPCALLGAGTGGVSAPRSRRGSSAYDYARTDTGNAQRLKRRLGDTFVWCGELGGWFYWSAGEGIWRLDSEGIRIFAEMQAMVADLNMELEYLADDPKAYAAFAKFVISSGNIGRKRGAIEEIKSLRGVNVEGSVFDAIPNILTCPNGVIELNSNAAAGATAEGTAAGMGGVSFRPHRFEDFSTRTTGTEYRPGAVSEAWNKFLDRFLPDESVRLWAQKLAGYSLYGGNPSRILVICKGLTSTGKTTFAEALRVALGGYAGPFPLSILRDNQDERARPDILQVLPRRFALTEEVSSAWVLHADQVKRATGGGVMGARAIHGKRYVERVPEFTPWIATNNTPTINGADAATRRRLRVIPFLHQIPAEEENGRFKEVLAEREGREAVLAWAVEGWSLYLADETLTDIPAAAAAMTMEVSSELSEMDEMLHEIAQFGPELLENAGALYAAYEAWCTANGVSDREVISANKFGRVLSQMGYERMVRRDGESGKSIRLRRGLALRPAWAKLSGGSNYANG